MSTQTIIDRDGSEFRPRRPFRWQPWALGFAIIAFVALVAAWHLLPGSGPKVFIINLGLNAEAKINHPGENYGFKLNFAKERAQLIVGQDFPAHRVDGRLIRPISPETYQVLRNEMDVISIDHAAATMLVGGEMTLTVGAENNIIAFPRLSDDHLWLVVVRAGSPVNVTVKDHVPGHTIALNYLLGAAQIHEGQLNQIARNGYQAPNCITGCTSVTLVTIDEMTENVEAYRQSGSGVWRQVWNNFQP